MICNLWQSYLRVILDLRSSAQGGCTYPTEPSQRLHYFASTSSSFVSMDRGGCKLARHMGSENVHVRARVLFGIPKAGAEVVLKGEKGNSTPVLLLRALHPRTYVNHACNKSVEELTFTCGRELTLLTCSDKSQPRRFSLQIPPVFATNESFETRIIVGETLIRNTTNATPSGEKLFPAMTVAPWSLNYCTAGIKGGAIFLVPTCT